MTLEQYQIDASRTCPDLGSIEDNILHMELGIITEVGEFLDPIKKYLAYGKELDIVNLQEEIADSMWYIANKARLEGITLSHSIFDVTMDETPMSLTKSAKMLLKWYKTFNLDGEDDYTHAILYLYRICIGLDLDFFKGLENNIAKLRVRFPDKFDANRALNRNLDAERKELEK